MCRTFFQSLNTLGSILLAILVLARSDAAIADTGVFVMKTDGGGERKVCTVERASTHRSPRWSHDGKRLAFEVADESGSRKSFVVNLDGNELKEVAQLGSPDWSPDDKQLALDSDGESPSGIFVQTVDGKGRKRVADGAWPRWSRDGKKIAYCDGNLLKVLDLERGGEQQLCGETFIQRCGSFDWSHDGRRLALFTRTLENGPRELYLVDADGGTSTKLTLRYRRPGMVGGHVTWSPDDNHLTFTIDSMLHTLDVAGDAEPRLIPDQSDNNRDPAVSPDGKWIAFVRRPTPGG